MSRRLFYFFTIVYAFRMFVPIATLLPSVILMVITIILIFTYKPYINRTTYSSYLFLFGVLSIFQIIMRLDIGDSILGLIYALFILVPSGLITHFFFENNDERLLDYVFYSIIIGIGITGFTTYLGCLQFPGVSREMATGKVIMYDASLLKYRNIGGFETIYIFTLMLPIWITIVKDKLFSWRLRILAAVVIVTSVMGVIQSEYTTALIFTLFSIAMFFLPNDISISRFILIAFFALIFIFLFKQLLPGILTLIADSTNSSNVMVRMQALSRALSGEGADAVESLARMDKFKNAFDAFISSPLFGTFQVYGGHSFFMVALGYLGLIGAVSFVVLIVKLYELFVLPLLNRGINTCLFFVCFMYLSYLILNPQPYLIAVLFLIPISCFYIVNFHERVDSTHAQVL